MDEHKQWTEKVRSHRFCPPMLEKKQKLWRDQIKGNRTRFFHLKIDICNFFRQNLNARGSFVFWRELVTIRIPWSSSVVFLPRLFQISVRRSSSWPPVDVCRTLNRVHISTRLATRSLFFDKIRPGFGHGGCYGKVVAVWVQSGE